MHKNLYSTLLTLIIKKRMVSLKWQKKRKIKTQKFRISMPHHFGICTFKYCFRWNRPLCIGTLTRTIIIHTYTLSEWSLKLERTLCAEESNEKDRKSLVIDSQDTPAYTRGFLKPSFAYNSTIFKIFGKFVDSL